MSTRNLTVSRQGTKNSELITLLLLFGPALLVICSLVIWSLSLHNIDLTKMNDLGLISVLPVSFYVAILLLVISFGLVLMRQPVNDLVAFLNVLAFIVIIHGTPEILYGTLRYSWAWKHVGIVDYIIRNGRVDPDIDYLTAYHNWPGFFALNALFTKAAGLNSALSYAGWGPVFFNTLNLGALLVIFKALTKDQRIVWLSVWLFFLTNWVGQDYFSPQAISYFFYLIILGALLTWFWKGRQVKISENRRFPLSGRVAKLYDWVTEQITRPEGVQAGLSPLQRIGFAAVLILIIAVIASTHQLTPIMLVSALAALIIFQEITLPSLLPLTIVIVVAWVIFMAVGFLQYNLYWIVTSLGALTGNFDANFINLSSASQGQTVIAWMDRGLSAFIWVLAILGAISRLRRGQRIGPAILLAFAPLPVLATNSYGGEMVFRIYFFGLPFIVFLAAEFLFPDEAAETDWFRIGSVIMISCVLLTGFLFAYYGKERMYYFTQNEVAASEYLNNTAPAGSLIVDVSPNWPKQFSNYEKFRYNTITDYTRAVRQEILKDPISSLSALMDDTSAEARQKEAQAGFTIPPGTASTDKDDFPSSYIMLTRSQEADMQMTGRLPYNAVAELEHALLQSSNFKLIYSNPDAAIFQYVDTN
jgi:hypothetical protein